MIGYFLNSKCLEFRTLKFGYYLLFDACYLGFSAKNNKKFKNQGQIKIWNVLFCIFLKI